MTRPVVLGIDSSTQSTKVLAIDLETGEIAGEGRAPHSGNDVQDPREWWDALRSAVRAAVTPDIAVRGMSISGQQHGCVLMDDTGEPVRDAPLWNNVDSATDAERLNTGADFVREVGTRLVASITITKLAEIQRADPDSLARATRVGLPHDWLNFKLTGELTTDRGDASGSGWWSPFSSEYRRELLALAIGEEKSQAIGLPRVLHPTELAGRLNESAARELGLPPGIPIGPGTGDNMAAALGVGIAPGEYVISLGTSGTAFALSATPTGDPSGVICGFADASGQFLPLVCLINCTRTLDATATLVGLDRTEALDLAAQVEPGAGGLLLEPYFGGERTPNLPHASGTLHGMTLENLQPANLVRAAIDGVAAGLAYAVDHLRGFGIHGDAIDLVGGGARHVAWQQAIADATQLPITVRGGTEHAARGAAIQIAAILRDEPIATLAAAWRPPIIATIVPRAGMRERFHLEARRALAKAQR
jgi:xylulokinase